MSHYKQITLCADDFGLNAGISQGILKLVRLNRLSAVSCMVNGPDFKVHGAELADLSNQVQLGLHFNLTEGQFMSQPNRACFGLNELLLKTHLRVVNRQLIANEFNAQLDAYIQTIGHLPDFIDGHQHVHQFPMIRKIILELYEQRLKHNGTYVRSTYPALSTGKYQFKSFVIARTGGRSLRSKLNKANILHNSAFSGVYDFSPQVNYRDLFKCWMDLAKDNTLIMCHPGEGIDPTDEIAAARQMELNYFLSDDFLADCEEHRVALTQRHAQ